ncbi:MAG: hypothetical protein WC613_04245 [Candidatus Aenigmatarchaeota archaeon]
MPQPFQAKLRRIGTSIGILLPSEQLNAIGSDVGDDVEIVLLRHRKGKDIERGFGMAKGFSKPFKRDKKTREF